MLALLKFHHAISGRKISLWTRRTPIKVIFQDAPLYHYSTKNQNSARLYVVHSVHTYVAPSHNSSHNSVRECHHKNTLLVLHDNVFGLLLYCSRLHCTHIRIITSTWYTRYRVCPAAHTQTTIITRYLVILSAGSLDSFYQKPNCHSTNDTCASYNTSKTSFTRYRY